MVFKECLKYVQDAVCEKDWDSQFVIGRAQVTAGRTRALPNRNKLSPLVKVGIPNFVSGPREYIMEGEYITLAMCSWFRIS